MMPDIDATPLLPGGPYISSPAKRNKILTSILIPLLLIGAVIFVSIRGDGVPKDPLERAKYYLDTYVAISPPFWMAGRYVKVEKADE